MDFKTVSSHYAAAVLAQSGPACRGLVHVDFNSAHRIEEFEDGRGRVLLHAVWATKRGAVCAVGTQSVSAARGCEALPGLRSLSKATQAVFGELETGAKAAMPAVAIMMIGEQPGDQEDLQGRPFVGPPANY